MYDFFIISLCIVSTCDVLFMISTYSMMSIYDIEL